MWFRRIYLFLLIVGYVAGCTISIVAGENLTTTEDPQDPIVVIKSYYYDHYDKRLVCPVFIVENPNQNVAFEGSRYQVAIYDEEGTVLGTAFGWITILFPMERLGVVAFTTVPSTRDVAELDVQIYPGRSVETELTKNPVTAEGATYIPRGFIPKVTGTINNPMARSVTNLWIYAVAYDEEDRIVGGGVNRFVNFVPAKGQTGVEVEVASRGAPAKVELYPAFVQQSAFKDQSGVLNSITVEYLEEVVSLDEAVDELLRVVTVGFVQEQTGRLHYAFVVENPDEVRSVYFASYRAVAYDEKGVIVGTTSGFTEMAFPEEWMGVTGELDILAGAEVARLEVDIDPFSAETIELPIKNPLSIEQVTYVPGSFFPKATGMVKSALDKDIEHLSLSAIAYDDGGKVVGVGSGFTTFVPAGGESAVEVEMYVIGEPTRLELYPKVLHPTALGLCYS